MRFDRVSFTIALALLALEVLIALFIRDRFVRPYLGDVLVVILIFFAVRTIWSIRPLPLAIGAFLFACLVEITQAMGLIQRLGWSDNILAKLVLGNTFQWGDLLCYLIGSVASLWIARLLPEGRQAH